MTDCLSSVYYELRLAGNAVDQRLNAAIGSLTIFILFRQTLALKADAFHCVVDLIMIIPNTTIK